MVHLGAALALLTSARHLSAQDGVVGGVLLAERSLRPIAGALMLAEDTTARTVTDVSGRFRLTGLARPAGAPVRLTIRRIGFHPLVQTVRTGETALRLVLHEAALELSEVVVTGTTEATERRALSNAVTSVRAPEVMERGAVSTVQQLLNGRAPGVTIQPGSGAVGAGARISIRGGTSFSLSNEPSSTWTAFAPATRT